jgi:hypothetical protein
LSAARRGASSKSADEAAPASFDQAADPFDPEAFNRRYAPGKEKAENKSEAADQRQ